MVSPRERPKSARRRIAGERSRAPGGTTPEAADPASEQSAPAQAAGTAAPPRSGETKTRSRPRSEPRAQDRTEQGRTKQGRTKQGRTKQGRTTSGPPTWVLAVLAGLLVAALALDGLVVWRELSQRQAAEASARALHGAVIRAPAVAERAAEALLSYRHDTLDQDVADAERFTSDGYRPQYTQSIEDLVARPASDVRATVKAEVLASGVVEASGQRSDVLLFVNQTTTSATSAEPKTALNRVVFTMIRQDGRWVVDEIRAL